MTTQLLSQSLPLRRLLSFSARRLSGAPPPPPPPSPTPTSPPLPPPNAKLKLAEAQAHLRTLYGRLTTHAREKQRDLATSLQALELERKLRDLGGRINHATGYEEIERLRSGVGEREKVLLRVREKVTLSKRVYSDAVQLRAASQREVNDLLQRKSGWSSEDVVKFTQLVQQDHENERREMAAKLAMEAEEENAERGFTDLMQAILQRYHEEQVWSDKIRSLSTYGSLAITSLNVLLFIITILLVEPWKRKRLVEGVEARLRANTNKGNETTTTSLTNLQNLITATQTKLDLIAHQISSSPSLTMSKASALASVGDSDEPDQVQGTDELVVYPYTEELEGQEKSGVQDRFGDSHGESERERERERELWWVGLGSAVVGIGISALWSAVMG